MLFGTAIFVATEVMFFLGLASAHVALRSAHASWPPLGLPRLPIEVTALNTVVLVASGVAAWRWGTVRDDASRLVRWMRFSAACGVVFLTVQGIEWARLLAAGLTSFGSAFGALFYTLVGAHALHVLGALVALVFMLPLAARGTWSGPADDGLSAMRLYWLFVVAVWPVLYGLVYLW